MTGNPSTRFLSIRLSTEEFDEVYQHLQQSTCRSLTEYVKKVLTQKPVTVKVRDQTKEDILQNLIFIKSRLEALLEKNLQLETPSLQHEITEIKSSIRQIAEKCSP